MRTLHVLIGIPASGKSTLGRRLRADAAECKQQMASVSSDAIRVLLTGDSSAPLDRDAEVWPLFHAQIEEFLNAGWDVIADATNLTAASRDPYLQHNHKVVRVVAHVMAVAFEAANLRNQLRDRRVPDHVMVDMQARFDEVTVTGLYDEGFDAVVLHDLAGDMIET